MADSYYDDSPEPTSNPEARKSEGDSNVAILPKTFFPSVKDLKPGSTCRVRVEEVRDDQVLVTYETKEAESGPPPDEEMMELMG